MRCPKCGKIGGQTKRTEHKQDRDGWSMVVRERKCSNPECGHIFPTFECYDYADVEAVFRMREGLADILKGAAILQQIDADARPVAV